MGAVVRKISPQGLAFIARHEGKVLNAYRCPAGVITIGFGFTMGSKVFGDWWRAKHGRALRMGDTIRESEARTILQVMIDDEYGRVAADKIAPRFQHHYDGSGSMLYNCGTGAAGWRWAQALARGDVAEAARLLRTTATTGGGKQLPGLVKRRAEEANLIAHGDYGPVRDTPALTSVVEHWEDFVFLGYDPNRGHDAVVNQFQIDHKLKVDGLIGPATRAALHRAVEAKRANQAAAAGGGAGAATGASGEVAMNPEGLDGIGVETATWALGIGITAVVTIIALSLLWRYRGRAFAWLPEPVKDFFEARGVVLGRRVRT